MKLLFTTAIAAFVASTSTAIDCKWSSDTHAIDCPYHTYVDRATGKLTHVQYSTKPFSRPLDKKDTQTYYEHDDSRTDNNGTASFSYFFNIGTNVDPTDPVLKKDGCAKTVGADPKDPLTGPAMAFQKDDNRDFKCHRIAGDVTVPENVVVGPISDDDPTVGFFMTVKGGDDCSDTWRGGSGGYEKRSFTLQVFCDTSSEAIGRLPEIETVDELVTCMCKSLLSFLSFFFFFKTITKIQVPHFLFFFGRFIGRVFFSWLPQIMPTCTWCFRWCVWQYV
jgi:hypothetical protein